MSVETLLTIWDWTELLYVPAIVCTVGLIGTTLVQWKLWYCRQNVVPRLSEADRAIEVAPVKRDGMSLHLQVPKECWCVTRDDLKQFRRLVKNAIHERRIVPTDRDAFDPEDDIIGPCIHTVNTQFIMPVTQAAGGASWALMKHPEGLPCELFVTHGWAEGIFEFIDKVLNSWPRSSRKLPVRNAYCCMLSNPQNLDISELCKTPETSPFAKALSRASHMLVVPNTKVSIYTRVWCAYEAFLGYSGGKRITTATAGARTLWLKICQAEFIVFTGFGGGFALSIAAVAAWGDAHIVKSISMTVFLASSVLYLAWRTYIGSWRLAVVRPIVVGAGGSYVASELMLVPLQRPGTVAFFVVAGIIALCCSASFEVDMVLAAEAVQETNELLNGFTGHLRDAKCSVATDGERIRKALADSGNEQAIDDAVEVLISMGTFSPRLRAAVGRAGLLNNVARPNFIVLSCGLAFWVTLPLEHFTHQYCQNVWLTCFNWALLLCWVLVAYNLPKDCVAFGVTTLLGVMPALFIYVVDFVLGTTEGGTCLSQFALAGFMVSSVIMTVLGPARTARVPLVGPLVVRLLLNCSHRRQTINRRGAADFPTGA